MAVISRRLWAVLLAAAVVALGLVIPAPSAWADTAPPSMSQAHWLYFGWEGDQPKSLAYVGGELSPGGGSTVIQYYLTSGSTTYYPNENASDLRDQATWSLADGYLPSPISSWPAGGAQITIQHFADSILSGAATAVYTQVTVANTTGAQLNQTLDVTAGTGTEVPLSGAPASSTSSAMTYNVSLSAHASVQYDFVALAAGSASSTQLSRAGSFATNYTAMAAYWNNQLAGTALPTSLPDPQLIAMYKANQIDQWEAIADVDGQPEQWSSGGNTTPGIDNYASVYPHDVTDMVAQYVREGDYSLAGSILTSNYFLGIPSSGYDGYLDTLGSWIAPYWLYEQDANNPGFFTPSLQSSIEADAHDIADNVNTTPGDQHNGLMDASNTFDNGSDYLVVDDLASIYGLQDYADLATAWAASDSSWSAEATWAQDEAASINTALNNYLTAYTIPRLGGYYNACLDSCSMLTGGYQGNTLGTTLMMGELPWDGELSGNTDLGTWSDYLDASVYSAYTQRAATAPGIPPDSWGAWSSGPSGYGTAYDAGAGVQLLTSSDPNLREQAIEDLEWLLANQSAPMQWGESFSQGSWSTPEADLEAWALSGDAKALLESNVSVASDGDVIIGRGIPTSWISSGRPTSWTGVPVGGGQSIGFTITPESGNQVRLDLAGSTTGQVQFELPLFANNISSATAGSVDRSDGIVTLPAGTTSTTVTLDNENAPAITVAHSTTGAYTFGAASDQELRAQTFFAGDSPTVTGVQVDIQKFDGTGQSDATVGLYPAPDGTPDMSDPLATGTIAAADVGTGPTVVSVPLSYTGLVQGQQYAVVLGQTSPSGSVYEWETSGSGGVYTFEKYNGTSWINESNLGDAWLTVDVEGDSVAAANLAGDGAGAYTFGQSSDQVTRGQMFLDTGVTQLTDVRVEIQTYGGGGQSDATVGLYAVDDGQPTGDALATATIAAADVGSSPTEIDVPLSYSGLVPGQQYAIVLGQETPSTSGYYEWETSGSEGTSGFGKFQPGGNWVDESDLGDAWLQVNGTLN